MSDLDSKSFEELTEAFSVALTIGENEVATRGELATVFELVKYQDAFVIELSKRLEQLEKRPAAKWCGTFTDGTGYPECSMLTHKGGLWIATRDTAQRPGDPDSGWRLCVKSGEATR